MRTGCALARLLSIHKNLSSDIERKMRHALRMSLPIKRILFAIQIAGAAMTAAKLLLFGLAVFGLTVAGDMGLFGRAFDVAMSTPVFAVAAMVTGQWIGEMLDARFYRIEGGVGGASRRHLIRRLRWTAALIYRPFWYPNEDRIKREVGRTNRALVAAGFAPVDWDENDNQDRNERNREYILACVALLKSLGVKKSARLSAAVKRRAYRF